MILYLSLIRVLAGLLMLTAPGSETVPFIASRTSAELNRVEQKVHQFVNQERRSRSLPELSWSDRIALEARRHATHIAEDRFFSHKDPLRGDIDLRLDKSGIEWIRCGENLYKGNYPDPAEDAIRCWLNSAGHRQNMMDAMFNETGVGVAQRTDGWIVIVQEFVTKQALNGSSRH